MKRYIFLYGFLIVLSTWYLFGADIGSDTDVERFNAQVIIEDGDRVAGFAALAGGFFLGNREVIATWDTFFPVSGNIELNGGTLSLNQDLIMNNITEFGTLGSIDGNCHVVEFSSKVGCIPKDSPPECTITFTVDSAQEDEVLSVDWSFDSEFVVAGLGSAATDELVVYAWDGSTLTLEDGATVGGDANSVAWHPTNDWIALGRSSGGGDELYTFTFDRSTSTLTLIDSISTGGGGNNGINSVAWHPDGGHLAIARDSAGSGVKVAVYEIDSAGMIVTVGGSPVTDSFGANGLVADWNLDGSFLGIGTEGAGGVDELRVYTFVASPLSIGINASFSTASNTAITGLAWDKAVDTELIAIGLPSGTNRLQLFRRSGGTGVGAGTLTQIPTTNIPVGTSVNTVHWHPDGSCLIAGLQDNAEGTGGELRVFLFRDEDLSLEDDQEVSENILTVKWSPSGSYLATGDDGLGGATPDIAIYQFDQDFGAGRTAIFSDVQLFFNGNFTFREAINFSGQNVLNGRGCTATFASTFTLTLESNASLLMKDITIKGLVADQLRAVDSTGTFSFQNTTFVIDNDCDFNTGHFEVIDEFTIIGNGHTFTYGSSVQSIIKGGVSGTSSEDPCDQKGFCGCMVLDNVTFAYTPDDPTLINLEDETSKIFMQSATLLATSSLQLTTGQLIIDGQSFFGGNIIIGDCTAANNLCVEFKPAANLDVVAAGKWTNKNL